MAPIDSTIKKTLAYWPLVVWLTCSSLFFTWAFSLSQDEVFTRLDLLMYGLSLVASVLLGFTLFPKAIQRGLKPAMLIITALAAAFAIRTVFSSSFHQGLFLPSLSGIHIEEIDTGAQLSLDWAYYAEKPQSPSRDVAEWDPDTDVSFFSLKRDNGFHISESGFLIGEKAGAELTLRSTFSTHAPVFCLTATGGQALISTIGKDGSLSIADNETQCVLFNQTDIGHEGSFLIDTLFFAGLVASVISLFYLCCCSLHTLHGKAKNLCIYLLAVLLPCASLLLICYCLKICPFGEKTFLMNDMFGEYADYMAYFRSILHDNNNLLYSFSKSIGDDLLSLIAFYVINPINWLVCLYNADQLPQAISLLVIIRFSLCGLTAAIYLRKGRGLGWTTLIFALCYALMSFSFVNAENTNLREGSLILPLVILGLDQLLEGKSPRLYIICLSAAVFLNYYSAYQICIFCLLYFCFRFMLRIEPGSKRQHSSLIIRFAFSSLLAITISAILLLPVIIQLQGGQKTFDITKLSFDLDMSLLELSGKFYNSAYDYDQISSSGLPNVFCGILISLSLPLFFLNRAIEKREKYLTAAFLLIIQAGLLVNAFNLALHGFNAPEWWPYRNSFIVGFALILTAVRCFEKPQGLNYFETALCFFASLMLSLCLIRKDYSWLSPGSIILNIVLTAVFCVLLPLANHKKGQRFSAIYLLSMLCGLDLFLNGYVILAENNAYQRSETVSTFQEYYRKHSSFITAIKDFDGSFYRMEKTRSRNANDPMQFNYNGISHYSSTLKRTTMNFLPKAGFRYYPFRFLYWEGSTVAIDSLLDVRYLISTRDTISKPYELVLEKDGMALYRNPYVLPMAFMTDPQAATFDLSKVPATFEMQNAIFSSLSGDDAPIFTPVDSSDPIYHNLKADNATVESCWSKSDPQLESWIEWTLTANNPDTLYAFFPASETHLAQLSLDDQPLIPIFDNFSYHVTKLGNFSAGQRIRLRMTLSEDKVCFSDTQFYSEDLETLRNQVSLLADEGAEFEKLSSSHLRASFNASTDGLLFFSIPYDKGWTVKIDGEKHQTSAIFAAFLGVKTTAGEHELELRFIPRGLLAGAALSLLSLVIFFLYLKKIKARE